jgi:hypothetical protein
LTLQTRYQPQIGALLAASRKKSYLTRPDWLLTRQPMSDK